MRPGNAGGIPKGVRDHCETPQSYRMAQAEASPFALPKRPLRAEVFRAADEPGPFPGRRGSRQEADDPDQVPLTSGTEQKKENVRTLGGAFVPAGGGNRTGHLTGVHGKGTRQGTRSATFRTVSWSVYESR